MYVRDVQWLCFDIVYVRVVRWQALILVMVVEVLPQRCDHHGLMDPTVLEHGEELVFRDKEIAEILCGVEVLRSRLLHAACHEGIAVVRRRTAVGCGDEQLLPCAAGESRLFGELTFGSL